ncbi:hypothetical protein CcCBS67573_g07406 [Chytriomyces confervae]|uniref:C2H2-type domain-containing protein n=1 Tax=Chytriomyces confervae TaxID=246404 RepID=A0A507EV78_9FUNG|nr:hypothetical protein CcCBS67573_g07406 [Chytriomyces confervae]
MKVSQLVNDDDDLVPDSVVPSPTPSHITVTSPPTRTNSWSPVIIPSSSSAAAASIRPHPYVRCLISTNFSAVPTKPTGAVVEPSNICPYCFKQFPKPHFLQAHIVVHATVLPYGCGCGHRFKRLQDLRPSPHEPPQYPTRCLNMSITIPSNWTDISCISSGARPTKHRPPTPRDTTTITGSTYSVSNPMAIPNLIDPYFVCPTCKKAFRKVHYLVTHMSVHKTKLAFECSCGKRFKRAQDMNRHCRYAGHNDAWLGGQAEVSDTRLNRRMSSRISDQSDFS